MTLPLRTVWSPPDWSVALVALLIAAVALLAARPVVGRFGPRRRAALVLPVLVATALGTLTDLVWIFAAGIVLGAPVMLVVALLGAGVVAAVVAALQAAVVTLAVRRRSTPERWTTDPPGWRHPTGPEQG